MSERWEKCKEIYSSHYPLSAKEQDHLYTQFKDHFCTNISGERFLFAHWLSFVIYSKGPGHHWKHIDEQVKISHNKFVVSFPHYEQITHLDAHKGTSFFEGKEIKWDQPQFHWKYLNNRTVHFNHSVTLSPPSLSDNDDNDTAKVAELLQSAETRVTAATQKLWQPNPSNSSCPGTPSQPPPHTYTRQSCHSYQPSPVPGLSQSSLQPPGSLPTPPVSKGAPPPPPSVKGKQRASISQPMASTLYHTTGSSTPPQRKSPSPVPIQATASALPTAPGPPTAPPPVPPALPLGQPLVPPATPPAPAQGPAPQQAPAPPLLPGGNLPGAPAPMAQQQNNP